MSGGTEYHAGYTKRICVLSPKLIPLIYTCVLGEDLHTGLAERSLQIPGICVYTSGLSHRACESVEPNTGKTSNIWALIYTECLWKSGDYRPELGLTEELGMDWKSKTASAVNRYLSLKRVS